MFNKKNLPLALTISIFVILISVFLIRPGLAGYSTYQQIKNLDKPIEEYVQTAEKCNLQISVLESNISSCNFFNDKLLDEVKTCTFKISEFEVEREQDKSLIKSLEDNLRRNITVLTESNDKYNSLSYNAARNICCKTKVDNPRINSYEVVDNKIVCLESGTKSLNC